MAVGALEDWRRDRRPAERTSTKKPEKSQPMGMRHSTGRALNISGGGPGQAIGARLGRHNSSLHARRDLVYIPTICERASCEDAQRGLPEHGPLRHDSGVGCVAPRPGQYADALSRRTKVCLMLVESLGGIYHASKRQLHTLSLSPNVHPASQL